MEDFVNFTNIFSLSEDDTSYTKISAENIDVISIGDKKLITVAPIVLTKLSYEAFRQISHLLRSKHLQQLRSILDDSEASENDKFVALDLLMNANIAAGMVLPMCQDTGSAIIMGKKGQQIWTGCDDEIALTSGVAKAYTELNLRYSQVSPVDMYEEVNTENNLPAQIDLYAVDGGMYEFLFMAKGGGSANKTFLYQQTKELLNPESLIKFCETQIRTLGTSACPPYHLAIVIGGISVEMNLKTVKLASAKYLDNLPTSGGRYGHAFRDLNVEMTIHQIVQNIGIGAQFGGKYFCHDVRVIRLPRHGASCPVGIGVSCSADRQIKGKIISDGIYLENLEKDPARYLPDIDQKKLFDNGVCIDLNQSMNQIREILSKYPVGTRVMLNGPMIVARDIAHAKLKERIDRGENLPQYFKDHPIYYAGPAKTPDGYKSGSFGPTTAGRMDSYVSLFQSYGCSMVMIAKGNRSRAVIEACKIYGGFYLGSVGGAAASLSKYHINKVDILEYPELGMEAIWRIEVKDFHVFIVIDDKGNDFYSKILLNQYFCR
ncbi:MAG: fumarate hydratase [Rhodospirillaceae bacterium]|jgi:fumarate hydratase class I|nr:fumarate hydratase [Rhodospirillaceae bacterium]